MVYINYPRVDLDNHEDLTMWRGTPLNTRNWGNLKPFLSEQPRFATNVHKLPKCWYSELPQGDDFALDVEHFRPKNSGSPLNAKQILPLEKILGYKIYQGKSKTV